MTRDEQVASLIESAVIGLDRVPLLDSDVAEATECLQRALDILVSTYK